jgi:SSS family solute:Na+ symporter
MVSKVYAAGIAWAAITCAWHLQLVFTGLWVAPRLRGLNLITVGDYFELKFGPLARELAVVNCVIFLVGALAAQMAAMGMVTNAILGIRYETALLIGAGVTVFYSTVGGIRAVVKTDVLQFVILVVGIGSAAAFLLVKHGGFQQMAETAGVSQFDMTGHLTKVEIVSLFFAFMLGETFVPVYTVRCFIARDSRHARRGVAGAGIFLLLFLPVATFVLGTSAQISPEVRKAVADEKQRLLEDADVPTSQLTLEEAQQRDKEAGKKALQVAFPALVRSTFHPVFAGIVIAAIVAAVMSSADSCLSCLATVVMEDHYRRHVNRSANDHQLLRVAQWTTLLAGVGAALIAWYNSNIADLLEFVYDFWAPTMVLPFLVGLFWYRENRIYAVVASMIAGMAATMVWRFGLQSPYGVGPALFGFGVAVVVFLVSLPLTCRLPLAGLFRPGHEPPVKTEDRS